MRTKTRRRIGGIFLATGSLVLLTSGPAFAQSLTAANLDSPSRIVCTANQTFALGSYSYGDLGDPASGAWTWLQNRGSTASVLDLSFATNSAVGYSISSSQSVDAGIIFAKVSASITEGVTYTHTDVETKTAGVNVPSHEYGEAGAANIYAKGNGTVTITYGDCSTAKVAVSKWLFPTTAPAGFITDTTTSVPASPPWPLAPS